MSGTQAPPDVEAKADDGGDDDDDDDEDLNVAYRIIPCGRYYMLCSLYCRLIHVISLEA